MSDQIKVDLSKVTVEEYLEYQVGISTGNTADSFTALMKLGEKAIAGGVMDRPATDIPMILSHLVKSLQEETDNITIALMSMREYLIGKDNE